MTRVLIVEDDPEFAELISGFLKTRSIESSICYDPYMALAENLADYSLVLLDLGLPGMDGLEVCKRFRAKSAIPIIISSARGSVGDKVLGLQLGSDDYLPKPYDPDELYARIISLLRRSSGDLTPKPKMPDFTIDKNSSDILFRGENMLLNGAEYEVMECLVKNFPHVASREQLLGSAPSIQATEGKSLEVTISKIRHKIKKFSDKNHILSIRGRGYRLVE